MESSIQVAVRVRPLNEKETALLAPVETSQPFAGDGGLAASPNKTQNAAAAMRSNYIRTIISPVDDRVLVFDPAESSGRTAGSGSSRAFPMHMQFHGNNRRARDVRYAFDRVFPPQTTQRAVYAGTVEPMLSGLLNGYNASVFAYGATGCGKTHTISGTAENPGLIFLAMQGLYERIEAERDQYDVQVSLSYLEIYNETIRDLLSPNPTPRGPGLALREDAASKISVVGITEHVPESPQQVLEMITDGNRRRTQSPTDANEVSSRSHAVLQLNVTRKPKTAGTVEEMCSASLNIIDLAGSERASATNNHGIRMKEGANINRSLLALGSCINALCQTGGARYVKGRHIPYRNSKLTRLLKFSLGGNCKTVMIVCVSPSSAHYEETHNTLKYANQAKNIQTKVTRNLLHIDRHVSQYVQAIASLRQEVEELKSKLANQSSASGTSAAHEAVLADALQTIQANADALAPSVCAAARDAAPAKLAAALGRVLDTALQGKKEQDASYAPLDAFRTLCIAASTPTAPAPALGISDQLEPQNVPSMLETNVHCAARFRAERAKHVARLEMQQHEAELCAWQELVHKNLVQKLVPLLGTLAHLVGTMQGIAVQLGSPDDVAVEPLAGALQAAAQEGSSAIEAAVGRHVAIRESASGALRTLPSPKRTRVRALQEPMPVQRYMRLVSPRRRPLRTGMQGRRRSIGPRKSDAHATLWEPAEKKEAAPTGEKQAEPRDEKGPPSGRADPKAPARLSILPSLRPPAPRPSLAARPRLSVHPHPESTSRPSFRAPKDVPRKPKPAQCPSETERVHSPGLKERMIATAPVNTSPRRASTAPQAPTAAGPRSSRRSLFQRQFLARHDDADQGSVADDSLLHTDLSDLSAQLPREDWESSLRDLSDCTAGSTNSSDTPQTPPNARSRPSHTHPWPHRAQGAARMASPLASPPVQ